MIKLVEPMQVEIDFQGFDQKETAMLVLDFNRKLRCEIESLTLKIIDHREDYHLAKLIEFCHTGK